MPGIALPESFPIFHSSVLLSFTSALGKEKGEEKEGGEGVEEKEEKKEGGEGVEEKEEKKEGGEGVEEKEEKKEGGEGKEKKGEEKEGIRGERRGQKKGWRRRDGRRKSIYYTQETSFKGQSISFLL